MAKEMRQRRLLHFLIRTIRSMLWLKKLRGAHIMWQVKQTWRSRQQFSDLQNPENCWSMALKVITISWRSVQLITVTVFLKKALWSQSIVQQRPLFRQWPGQQVLRLRRMQGRQSIKTITAELWMQRVSMFLKAKVFSGWKMPMVGQLAKQICMRGIRSVHQPL